AAHPLDKRSRLYRIKEGFFDLWLAMSGSRAVRKRLGYLVKLFEIWYQDRMARDKKRLELRQQFEVEPKPAGAQENNLVYLDYLADLGDCDERCEAKLKLSLDYLKMGEALKAKDLLAEVQPLAQTPGIFTWMTGQALQWADGGTDRDVEQWFDDLIEYWKIQRSGDLERAVDIAQRLGTDLSDKGLHKIRIELLRDALGCAPLPGDQITLTLQIAESQIMDGQPEMALQFLQTALHLCREIGDKKGEGATLNNISTIYFDRGDYDTALQYLQQSLAIQQEIGDKAGLCAILFNIGLIHLQNDETPQAVQAWVAVYRSVKAMNLAKGLDTLEELANDLNLDGGLEAWERLSKLIEETT
ncbi:MAG: tetratricopeptide repeat protein, partial [Desulfoprunum sp.]|nr:tetratricopeptide repeat protein [Desulfoprunum sp.]